MIKESFPLREQVNCDKCGCAFMYVKQPDGRTLLWHHRSDCERSCQFFEEPRIKLARVLK